MQFVFLNTVLLLLLEFTWLAFLLVASWLKIDVNGLVAYLIADPSRNWVLNVVMYLAAPKGEDLWQDEELTGARSKLQQGTRLHPLRLFLVKEQSTVVHQFLKPVFILCRLTRHPCLKRSSNTSNFSSCKWRFAHHHHHSSVPCCLAYHPLVCWSVLPVYDWRFSAWVGWARRKPLSRS